MNRYTTFHTLEPSLPDGHLAQATVTLAPRGHLNRIVFAHLDGHIDPGLLRDIAEVARHAARSMFLFDRTLLGASALWDSRIERVPEEHLPPLHTFTLCKTVCGGRDFYLFRCRDDLITQALADELNEEVLPPVYGALLPRTAVPVRGVPYPAATAA